MNTSKFKEARGTTKKLKMSYQKFMRMNSHESTKAVVPFRRQFDKVELSLTTHGEEVAGISMEMLSKVEQSIYGGDTLLFISTPYRDHDIALVTSRDEPFTVDSNGPMSEAIEQQAIDLGNRMIGFVGEMMAA